MKRFQWLLSLSMMLSLPALPAGAAEKFGLEKGDVELKSAGPLTFSPDGILFVGDAKAATVFA
ncbi:MAG: hypothetical protein KF774_21460, partial [Planctomyces sp.]|nr:hypothetical protein [Planctomyces sp.]